jgi:hypothetical protein
MRRSLGHIVPSCTGEIQCCCAWLRETSAIAQAHIAC